MQLIDLDAAKGAGDNTTLARAICARLPCRLGGGIRWTVGLKPGRHVVRAVYRGRWDLRAAIRLKPVYVR